MTKFKRVKIEPIEIVSLLEFKETVLEDLTQLFQKLPSGIKGYFETDFSFKNADAEDINRIYYQLQGSHASTWYDEKRTEKKIYFDHTYFAAPEN